MSYCNREGNIYKRHTYEKCGANEYCKHCRRPRTSVTMEESAWDNMPVPQTLEQQVGYKLADTLNKLINESRES